MIAYITLGGILGTLARYRLHHAVRHWIDGHLPELRGGLTIGFCGAFTTMSTFSYESIRLLGDGEYRYAGLYMGGSVLGCLAAD